MSHPFPYRLAIVDLDETLLSHDKEVSPANFEALARLRAAGVEVVAASGRHHLSITSFQERTGCRGWIVSSAGAMVRHAVTDEILVERNLSTDLALEIWSHNREHGHSLIGYHRTGVFVEEITNSIRLDAKRSRRPPVLGDLRELAREGLQKLMWTTHRDEIDRLHPLLEKQYRDRLYVVHTEKEVVEFLSPLANKALGAQAVAERMGIAREQVLAFGDGNNDVPVLTWAGCSVAMDHGREAARRAATYVTPPGPPEEAFARGVDLLFKG